MQAWKIPPHSQSKNMIASITLPLENMTGIGGWIIYILGASLFLLAIAWVGYLALRFWISTVRLFVAARRRGGKSLVKRWEAFVGISMVLVLAILVWVFVRMVIFQIVQLVR
ncbi:MAG TPA: hypothetical protein VKK61_07395, partial [Tepidisphaeraceae bacterium]|nr:hypothetical protein [Tepidisphaeraceae bacterium]